ncbi:hypothetical protein [Frigoribacterium sp. VKM Ac-2836]|uniref:hypothetical protein n=1 Tax=Frigoribacterium sp. VKM Ac-2836 TaxID=2739014 RepID=UPI0015641A46|nr:hypothetical protein [Frigoribacterium sp. VKM Ac-2836]NRD25702.1 hypothetical protein [Frigoribacterium sp. VKM Ac-2836]
MKSSLASTSSSAAARIRLPPAPARPHPTAPPVVATSTGAVASACCALAPWAGTSAVLGSAVVTALVVLGGWSVDRHLGVVVTARRRRSEFLASLDAVDEAVARLRAARTRELADWYPTADRLVASGPSCRPTRALVLGVGRASSGLVLEGRPEDDLEPGDPAVARLARLRVEAATLDEAPLCVALSSTVRVVGPPVVAEAVASGLRRQVRAGGPGPTEAADAIECVLVDAAAADGPPPTPLRPVDTIVVIGQDGEAVVTRKDGRRCRQSLRVAFWSVRDDGAPSV